MGDIADMMIDGILDSETGEFIDDDLSRQGGSGFPRTMNDRVGFKTYSGEVNGIKKYLKMKTNLNNRQHYQYCLDYVREHIDPSVHKNIGWEELAQLIQADFEQFADYVNNNLK